jgi:hypothetical protein
MFYARSNGFKAIYVYNFTLTVGELSAHISAISGLSPVLYSFPSIPAISLTLFCSATDVG